MKNYPTIVTDEEFKATQEARHTSNHHDYPSSPWFEEVFTEFIDLIKEPFVDIGCRNGKLLDDLKERGIQDVTGIEVTDIADHAIAMGRNVVKTDIQKRTPFEDGQFKSATMLHVIEHCQNYHEALDEIKRIVDGYIMFIIPVGVGPDYHHYAHFVDFESRQELIDALIEHGYRIIKDYDKGAAVNVVIAKTR